jgi:hypothetical protein
MAKEGVGHGGGLAHMIASQFSAPAGGAIAGAVGGYHFTPEDASWATTARNVVGGAGGGALTGWLVQHRGMANEQTMKILGDQLSNPDPAIYQKALKRVAANPQFMYSLRRAEASIAAQFAQQYGSKNQAPPGQETRAP